MNVTAYERNLGALNAFGFEQMGSRTKRGCYAGAIACALTVLGRPTTSSEAERHWERQPGKLPTVNDMLKLEAWVMSRGVKLREITPPGALDLQKYYKPGSTLGYEDFMEESVALFGPEYATWAKKNYDNTAYDQEMSQRRARMSRVRSEKHSITPQLLERELEKGPVIAYVKEAPEHPTHVWTLWGVTHNGRGGKMVGVFDPEYGGQQFDNLMPEMLRVIDPKQSLLTLTR